MTERLLYIILAGCLVGVYLLSPEPETDPLVRAIEEANRE